MSALVSHRMCKHKISLICVDVRQSFLCSCAAICGCPDLGPSACPRTTSQCATAGRMCLPLRCGNGPAQRLPPSARPSAGVSWRWQLTWHATGSPGLTAPRQRSPQQRQLRPFPRHRSPAGMSLQWALCRSLLWQQTWQRQHHGSRRTGSCRGLSSCFCRLLLSPRALPEHQRRCLRRLWRQCQRRAMQ